MAMVATDDGFGLAEEALRSSGQVTVLRTRQSGDKDLKLGDILKNFELLVAARRDAFGLVDSDPHLKSRPELISEVRAMLGDQVEWLFVG